MFSRRPSPLPTPGGTLQILLVENHPDTSKYLALYLAQCGHTVNCASTVAQADHELQQTAYDLLLTDIGLADGTGWELLENSEVPRARYAIAMSGRGGRSDSERSRSAGFRQHLLKPIDPDVLEHILAEILIEKEAAGR